MRRLTTFLLLAAATLGGCDCGEETSSLGGQLGVRGSSLDFGSVAVGGSKELTFVVENDGSADLTVLFTVDGAAFTVSPADAVLTPNTEATITVTFAPTATGPASGKVLVSSDAEENASAEVALAGVGIEADVTIEPDALAFGDWPRDRPDTDADDRDEPSPPPAITVENTGSDVLRVTAAAFADDAAGQFTGDLATLVGEYQPGEERSAEVRFQPTSLGEVTGSVRIETAAGSLPEKTIALTGRGVAPVLRLCARLDDDPASELCLKDKPEDYAQAEPYPFLDFGPHDELAGRAGRITLSNEGNVPLTVSELRYAPSSPDLRLWLDEARTQPLDPATFEPVLCPAGAPDASCTHEGELVVYVDYLARGSRCCYEFQDGIGGDQTCVDLAPGGVCREAADADEGLLTVISTDRLYRFVTVPLRGRSRIPVIVVSSFNGDLFFDSSFYVRIENDGEAPLRVLGLSLWDPAGARTCQPDGTGAGTGSSPCSCAGDPTLSCGQFQLVTQPPLDVAAQDQTEVELRFLDPNAGRHELELRIESTDPVQRTEISTLVVNGLGIRP